MSKSSPRAIKITNILTTLLIIWGTYALCRYSNAYHGTFAIPINVQFLDMFSLSRNFGNIFVWGTGLYSLAFVVYYCFVSGYAKSYYFFVTLAKIFRSFPKPLAAKVTKEEKIATLAVLVKIVFLPLMFVRTFTNAEYLINTLSNVINYRQEHSHIDRYDYYGRHLHRLFLNLILFLDVTIFFVGYAIEFKSLKNKIISVEPTFLGWIVTLACYPMLNTYTSKILGRYSSNYPDFGQYLGVDSRRNQLGVYFGIVIIVLMGIYLFATFALGRKASNLTHRGIVTHGVYRIVRHPAYIAKSAAWIVGAFPLIADNIAQGRWHHALFIVLSLTGWCLIYHMRAVTEERHLSQDPEYLAYKKKVKRMYIPKVI